MAAKKTATKKPKTPTPLKPYATLAQLEKAKRTNKLPRGTRVRLEAGNVVWFCPAGVLFSLAERDYTKATLKAARFTISDD